MLDRETVERLLQNNLDAKLNSELSKYDCFLLGTL